MDKNRDISCSVTIVQKKDKVYKVMQILIYNDLENLSKKKYKAKINLMMIFYEINKDIQ